MHWPSFLLGMAAGIALLAALLVAGVVGVAKVWSFNHVHSMPRRKYREACRMASIGALSRSPRQRRPKKFPLLRARRLRPGDAT